MRTPRATKTKKPIPFDFVLEMLQALHPVTRPMFGAYAVYVLGKIVLILREKDTYRADNGVWLCTTREHHESLSKEFQSIRSIGLFESSGPTGWQNLPSESEFFESDVEKACGLILSGDPRIGKYPKIKSRREKTRPKKNTQKPKKR